MSISPHLGAAINIWRFNMSLTKAGIIENVTQETGLTKRKSADAVGSFFEILKDTLACGDDILISGFGQFCVCDKAERRGRNPTADGD